MGGTPLWSRRGWTAQRPSCGAPAIAANEVDAVQVGEVLGAEFPERLRRQVETLVPAF